LSKGRRTVILFLPDGESVVSDPGVTEGVRENFSERLKIGEGIFPKQMFELHRQVRLQYRADKVESHVPSRSVMVEGDSSILFLMTGPHKKLGFSMSGKTWFDPSRGRYLQGFTVYAN
jgi:hypothetical protein